MSPRAKRVGVFTVLAIGLAWMFRGVLALGGWQSPAAFGLFGVVMMTTPALAAIVTRTRFGEISQLGLGLRLRPNWWLLVALWLPGLLVAAVVLASLLVPGVSFDPSHAQVLSRLPPTMSEATQETVRARLEQIPSLWLLVLVLWIPGAAFNTIPAMGEELGWRGFLYQELRPLGFWTSSAITGVLWGLWHTPAILMGHNYPGQPMLGLAMMTLLTVLMSPLLTFIREKSGNIWGAALFHGSINAAAGAPLVMLKGGSPFTTGLTGAAGMGVLALLNLALIWQRRAAEKTLQNPMNTSVSP